VRAGVYSHIENMQPLIGATCEALGIPNNPHTAYQIARNKFLARKVLGDAGLATTKVCQTIGLWPNRYGSNLGVSFKLLDAVLCSSVFMYLEIPRPIPVSCCPGGRSAQHG
jgi:hypothetical protein